MSWEHLWFQRKTVDFGLKNPYSIYGLVMGTGKSLCGLSTAVESASRCLIICPAYLRLKWANEVRKFYPGKVVSLFKNDKEFYPVWDTDFAIMSYNFLTKADELFEWADIVIFDEAHLLKTMDAKRTEAAHKLVYENSIKRCLLLTGTPIQNRVYEFYSLIAMCNYNPKIVKSEFLEKYPSYVDFANHFSFLKEFEMYRGNKRVKIQQWEGYRNVEELKYYLKDIYIHFGDEVLGLMPPEEIQVPISYDQDPELLAAFESFVEGGDQNSVASDVKAKAALAKVPFTAEYVKNLLEQGERVVVYTDHVESSEALGERLGVKGISGKTPMKERQRLADEFERGESQVIVATIGSFSTGIDLISGNHMVFNDPNWVPGNMEQAMYRIRRLGQLKTCFFHYIIGSYQDGEIYGKLSEKIKTIKAVFAKGKASGEA
jgi:SNF2 family DNA or RNA helicase